MKKTNQLAITENERRLKDAILLVLNSGFTFEDKVRCIQIAISKLAPKDLLRLAEFQEDAEKFMEISTTKEDLKEDLSKLMSNLPDSMELQADPK
ncbi:MAG: hypothetical protein IPM48_14280 [Saprospiraceae bacterium]|nr:hypothetical protein [Saprospiraceae bacterium]